MSNCSSGGLGAGDGRGKRHGRWDDPSASESESSSEEDEFGVTKDRTMGLYCEVCDITSSSVQHLQMHFAGSKHKKKLEMAGLSTTLRDYVERPKNLDIWKSTVRCILCKVIMVGAECLVHAKASQHQRKLSKMSERNKDFYSEVDNSFKVVEKEEGFENGVGEEGFSCGLCNIELSGKEHLELHLSGKKHQKKAHWIRIGDKESNAREYKQVWCSMCRIFVNDFEGFEGHIRGKQHIKMLKRDGVKWKVLVDSYGEDSVGAEVPLKQPVKKDRDGRHSDHTHHIKPEPLLRHSGSPSRHDKSHNSISDRKGDDHSHKGDDHSHKGDDRSHKGDDRSHKGDDHSHKGDESPGSSRKFPGLPSASWAHQYSSIPQYDPKLPKVLREGKGHTQHIVVYQKPHMALGSFLATFEVNDPRIDEMEKATRIATWKREREEEERDRRERRRSWSNERRRDWEPRDRWRDRPRERSRSRERSYYSSSRMERY